MFHRFIQCDDAWQGKTTRLVYLNAAEDPLDQVESQDALRSESADDPASIMTDIKTRTTEQVQGFLEARRKSLQNLLGLRTQKEMKDDIEADTQNGIDNLATDAKIRVSLFTSYTADEYRSLLEDRATTRLGVANLRANLDTLQRLKDASEKGVRALHSDDLLFKNTRIWLDVRKQRLASGYIGREHKINRDTKHAEKALAKEDAQVAKADAAIEKKMTKYKERGGKHVLRGGTHWLRWSSFDQKAEKYLKLRDEQERARVEIEHLERELGEDPKNTKLKKKLEKKRDEFDTKYDAELTLRHDYLKTTPYYNFYKIKEGSDEEANEHLARSESAEYLEYLRINIGLKESEAREMVTSLKELKESQPEHPLATETTWKRLVRQHKDTLKLLLTGWYKGKVYIQDASERFEQTPENLIDILERLQWAPEVQRFSRQGVSAFDKQMGEFMTSPLYKEHGGMKGIFAYLQEKAFTQPPVNEKDDVIYVVGGERFALHVDDEEMDPMERGDVIWKARKARYLDQEESTDEVTEFPDPDSPEYLAYLQNTLKLREMNARDIVRYMKILPQGHRYHEAAEWQGLVQKNHRFMRFMFSGEYKGVRYIGVQKDAYRQNENTFIDLLDRLKFAPEVANFAQPISADFKTTITEFQATDFYKDQGLAGLFDFLQERATGEPTEAGDLWNYPVGSESVGIFIDHATAGDQERAETIWQKRFEQFTDTDPHADLLEVTDRDTEAQYLVDHLGLSVANAQAAVDEYSSDADTQRTVREIIGRNQHFLRFLFTGTYKNTDYITDTTHLHSFDAEDFIFLVGRIDYAPEVKAFAHTTKAEFQHVVEDFQASEFAQYGLDSLMDYLQSKTTQPLSLGDPVEYRVGDQPGVLVKVSADELEAAKLADHQGTARAISANVSEFLADYPQGILQEIHDAVKDIDFSGDDADAIQTDIVNACSDGDDSIPFADVSDFAVRLIAALKAEPPADEAAWHAIIHTTLGDEKPGHREEFMGSILDELDGSIYNDELANAIYSRISVINDAATRKDVIASILADSVPDDPRQLQHIIWEKRTEQISQ